MLEFLTDGAYGDEIAGKRGTLSRGAMPRKRELDGAARGKENTIRRSIRS